ncbi:hypothetical protein EV714DRAFT_271484 [Schizophyllum commune]
MATDPLADLWQDALDAYERKAGITLSSPGTTFLETSDDIFKFIDHRKSEFSVFRADGEQLRSKLEPIAWTVRTLCDVLGEALSGPFSPAKAIFTAIGVAIDAAIKVQKDFDAIEDAFETMEHYLRIIKPNAETSMHIALREASVNVLVQILTVLGVVVKMQKGGRLKAWLNNIRHSDVLDKALDELRRLATNQQQATSAVTLLVSQRTLAIFTDSAAWEDEENILRTFLERVLDTTRETYDLLRKSNAVTQRQNTLNRKALEDIQSKLLDMNDVIAEGRKNDDLGAILQWLEYPDCSAKINTLLYDRTKGTGSWFLDSQEFASFKSGELRVLWLQGSVGCGKSTIMASAMRDLQVNGAISQPRPLTIAHFFDATNGPRHRNLVGLISSLLCQLCHLRNLYLIELGALRAFYMSGGSQPSLDRLQGELMRVLEDSPTRVFIVLDALDEATDEDIVHFLKDLCLRRSVSLLISSRSETYFRKDLERLSPTQLLVTKSRVARDIAIHLDNVLAGHGALANVKGHNVNLVRKTLRNGAGGNFRWTVLQIKELAVVAGLPNQLRRRIKNMPKTISDTYRRVLKDSHEQYGDDIIRVLAWVTFARGMLTKEECAELLAFDFPNPNERPIFDILLRPSSTDEIFRILSSAFISYHDDFVRIAHASVKEFLLDHSTPLHIDRQRAYLDMARMCMSYLESAGFDGQPIQQQWRNYHLYYHASRYWAAYADQALEHNVEFAEEIASFASKIPQDPSSQVFVELAVTEQLHRGPVL